MKESRYLLGKSLRASSIETPLGPMVAVADDAALLLLAFDDTLDLAQEILQLKRCITSLRPETPQIINLSQSTKIDPLHSITNELKAYFAGTLKKFTTPIRFLGTAFQNQAWLALLNVPYGTTRSYKEQSLAVGKKAAYRAVGSANGVNRLAIIVPCHRIIASNGSLGGYSSGLARKKWLLDHEKQQMTPI